MYIYIYIYDGLHDLVSVTFWHLYDHSNAYKYVCVLMLFSPSSSFYPFV